MPVGAFTAGSPQEAPDYVALGHLHGPQRVSPEGSATLARYAGSPLAYSFSEKDHRKSTALVSIGDEGGPDVELIPAPRPRALSDIRGTLAEICSPAFAGQAEDWVRVAVTDDHRPAAMMAAVRDWFPHALIVRHEPTTAPRLVSAQVHAATDPLEVFTDFVSAVSGAEPDDAEGLVLRAAYEAVLAEGRSA